MLYYCCIKFITNPSQNLEQECSLCIQKHAPLGTPPRFCLGLVYTLQFLNIYPNSIPSCGHATCKVKNCTEYLQQSNHVVYFYKLTFQLTRIHCLMNYVTQCGHKYQVLQGLQGIELGKVMVRRFMEKNVHEANLNG